jgi:vesicle-associated membrane protein 7
LEDIQSRFSQSFGDRAKQALSMSLNSEFKKVLRKQQVFIFFLKLLKEYFSNASQSDNITKVKGQIDEVKGIMISNIDKVLERGNQIDSLVVQTEELSNVSSDFRVKSKAVKNAMFWKNVKLILILLVIIVVRIQNFF